MHPDDYNKTAEHKLITATLIVIVVVFVILAVVGGVALLANATAPDGMAPGTVVQIKASGLTAVVQYQVGAEAIVRVDNGPGTAPRYSEATFQVSELTP